MKIRSALELTWSMDFGIDVLDNVRRIKCLTYVDVFTQEGFTITTTLGITGVQVPPLWIALHCFKAIRRR